MTHVRTPQLTRRSRRRLRTLRAFRTLALIVAVAAFLPAAPAHAAVEREIQQDDEPADLVSVSPVRLELDVQPGQRTSERVTVYNDSEGQVRLRTRVLDLGIPADENLAAVAVEDATRFGARDWVTVEVDDTVLEPFESIKFDVVVEPPLEAPIGSSYAAVEFDVTGALDGSNAETNEDQQVGIRIVTNLQLLLTVPGDVTRELTLLEAGVRDAFRLGGRSLVAYRVRYRNDGTVNDHATGTVRVVSLFGNTVTRLPLRKLVIIRGATRADRVVWSDPPRFGVFSAELRLRGDDGKVITRELGRVYLLPPWWLLVVFVLAVVLPPALLWWRRRREWLRYLEDEDWDDEGTDIAHDGLHPGR